MSTCQTKTTNTNSNLNMNSYQAFQILMKEGKLNSMKNINDTYKRINDKSQKISHPKDNYNTNNDKNPTKYVFKSNSQRFDWQSQKPKNFSDTAYRTHKEINNDQLGFNITDNKKSPQNWKGMLLIQGHTSEIKNEYSSAKPVKEEWHHKSSILGFMDIKDQALINEKEHYVKSNLLKHREKSHFKLQKSSSMQDIFQRTDNNTKPFKKFSELKYAKSKIFSNIPLTPEKKGVKRASIVKNNTEFENVNINNHNNNYHTNLEIKFYNLKNKTNSLRNYMNPCNTIKSSHNGCVSNHPPKPIKCNNLGLNSKSFTNNHTNSSKCYVKK